MLPSKRAVAGEVVEEDSTIKGETLLKKPRIDSLHLCAAVEATDKNSSGNNYSSNNKLNNNGNNSGEIVKLSNMALDDGNPAEIDEDLHSRQLAVYGRETMRRLFASNILVSGMQGLGAEIAKNLILAGVKSVTLHDEGTVELWDLSSNFIFSEVDVGKNRALASVQKLQELNNAVLVSTNTTKLTKELLSNFQAVVFTDITIEKAIEFDEYCRSHQPPISFIKSEVRGLFGSVFCDFGPEFTVVDVDGEEPHTGIIASISNDNPALVSCVDDERLEFQDGDLVVFSEVIGMTELNDGKPRKVKNARPYSFSFDEDTTNYGLYERGGIVTQVKQPKVLNFKSLREALKDPGDFLLSDFSKFDRPPLLHLAFQALDKFVSDLGRFPVAGSEDDAQKLVSLADSINESLGDAKLQEIDNKLMRHFAFGARAVLNPMAAMFGGIVGQEVVKACSGKFHPLYQFFYFDSIESLPSEPLDPNDVKPLNTRYDAQISVFGSKLQKKLEEAKVFLLLGFFFFNCDSAMASASHSPALSTFGGLVEELTRDANRVQPRDILQFCASWFQNRLEEQRTRMRDVLASHPHLNPSTFDMDITLDTNKMRTSSYYEKSILRSSIRTGIAESPFGTLDVPGNALLSPEDPFKSFKFDRNEPTSTSPLSTTNPFGTTYEPSTPTSHNPGDWLHPPTSTIFARRTSVSAESIIVDGESDEPLPLYPKTDDQIRRIKASIAKNLIFRDLDEEQETGVLNAMRELKVNRNHIVIRQGDVGEYFYVVESGLLHCYIRPEPLPPHWFTDNGPPQSVSPEEMFVQPGYHHEFGKKVAECIPGTSFGELALMYGHPRAATVLSIEPSTLWCLDRITFRTIILKAAHRRKVTYEHFLSTVPLLSSLDGPERSKIADALVSKTYYDGEPVVMEGAMGDTFFFVEEGEALVTKKAPRIDQETEDIEVGRLTKGDYFGELALLRRAPRAATVSAVMRKEPNLPKLKVAALDEAAFTRLLGPLHEIMERKAATYLAGM